MSSSPLRFDDGPVQFRQRIICSILSRRPLLVKNIRHLDQDPGLRDYEASFLRLIDSLTNGTSIEINETGSQFKMRPGIVINGEVSHVCCVSRSIGWFLEGILPLAAFGKRDLKLTLTGVTDGYENEEVSIDYIKASMLPVLKEFGVGADESEGPGAMLRVTRRGAAPGGGGEARCGERRERRVPPTRGSMLPELGTILPNNNNGSAVLKLDHTNAVNV